MTHVQERAGVVLQVIILMSCVFRSSCRLNTKSEKSGASLDEEIDVLETLPYSSQYSCAASCKMNPRCQSVRFDRRTLECRLLGATVEPSQRVEDKQIVTGVSKWEDSISGQCTKSLCESGEICWVDRQNRPICYVPPMCPDLNQPANGNVEISESDLGTFASYRCHQDYISCGGQHHIKCHSNGSWDQLDYTCSRNGWHNLTVPCKMVVPCPLKTGSAVEVLGTPLRRSESTLSINLCRDSDIIFHLAFRFQYRGMMRSTVLNNRIANQWSRSRIYRIHFPLRYGREFNITIMVEEERYRVLVDGTSHYRFKHRSPVRAIDKITILKEVEVKSVRVIYAEP